MRVVVQRLSWLGQGVLRVEGQNTEVERELYQDSQQSHESGVGGYEEGRAWKG